VAEIAALVGNVFDSPEITMAITKVAKGKAQAFEAAAPAPPVRSMRGRKRPLAITLPPELITEYDELAQLETRSRVRMMEHALREWAAEYRARKAAKGAAT
jgi:hypothetical protein